MHLPYSSAHTVIHASLKEVQRAQGPELDGGAGYVRYCLTTSLWLFLLGVRRYEHINGAS